MYNDNNDNNSSGNNSNKGKFSERLKKMRRNRLKLKKKGTLEENDEFILVTIGRNLFKIFLALPAIIYTNITGNVKRINDSKKDNITNDNEFDNSSEIYSMEKKIKVNEIMDMDISLLKKKKENFLSKHDFVNADKIKVTTDMLNNEIKKEKLQKEIVAIIKKKLVKNINELEILQSELYILNKMNLGDTYLSECQQDIKNVKKMLSKVKSLKEKYDYLKDNVDFQYMLEYEDDLLMDKILELKNICSMNDIKKTIDDYKLLEEYKFLYLKIDKLEEDVIRLEEYKSKKVEELRERDIDFDRFKNDIYNVDVENEKYANFVREQQLILKELNEKISNIDSHEVVTYRLKGFNQLLGNSFKYLGLLLINPLKGLIPGIATQTIITKNMVHNLYNNLEWEENKKMVYDVIDYSTSINVAMNNLEDMALLVNSTLEDIVSLKRKYEKEFSKYDSSFASYHETIKKLNKMENAVLGTKIKIDSMQERVKEHDRKNSNKLKIVKKLNSSDNN